MTGVFCEKSHRRIYLFRHAEAAYLDENNNRFIDSLSVGLTAIGRDQAASMAIHLSDVNFDKAISSGLPRTSETTKLILGNKPLEIETITTFEEIREQGDCPAESPHNSTGNYNQDEHLDDFRRRILAALNLVLSNPDWNNLLLVAHGGVNRVILGEILSSGLNADSTIEQNACCLNIIDFEHTSNAAPSSRAFIRTINQTLYDPIKLKTERGK